MSHEFSTDKAYDGRYNSLENRCFDEQIDYETARAKSIRFRSWQDTALDAVKRESGTNRVQVVYSAYMMGLKKVRDVVSINRISDLGDFRANTRNLMLDWLHDPLETHEMTDRAVSGEINDPVTHHGSVGDPTHCYIKDSAVSEVEDTFKVDAKFGGWIHRAMVSLGLTKAKSIERGLENHAAEVRRAIDGAYDKSRIREEQIFRWYLSESYPYWIEEGVKQEQLDLVRENVELMETDNARVCEVMLDSVAENAEIIQGSDR